VLEQHAQDHLDVARQQAIDQGSTAVVRVTTVLSSSSTAGEREIRPAAFEYGLERLTAALSRDEAGTRQR
jgi:hypothetical protein